MGGRRQRDEREARALRVQVAFGSQWLVLLPLFLGMGMTPLVVLTAPRSPWATLAVVATTVIAILATVARSLALVTVGSDELWAVVDDAAAPPEARARAAAALRGHAGGDPRDRLLRIAADTAEPALAKAFRVAAAEDDAELEAAVAEVEARTMRHPGA